MGPFAAGGMISFVGAYTESYTYDAAGRLYQVTASEPVLDPTAYIGALVGGFNPQLAVTTSAATLRAQYSYDAMGHETEEKGFATNGTSVIYDKTSHYDTAGRNDSGTVSTLKSDGKTYTSTITNTFGSGATYALGAVVSTTSVNKVNGGSAVTTVTSNTFVWWDAAVQNTIGYNDGAGHNYTTTFSYNGLGQMTQASIADGMQRTVTFSLDENGQIIRRDETRPSNAPSAQTGSPHELWYYLGDRQIGYVGNNGGDNPTTAGSLEDLQGANAGGTFRDGATASAANVEFAAALDQNTISSQGSTAGSYTVRAGDTLQSIARQLYGDAGLWYAIADANGIQSAAAPLSAGQQLTLPAGVIRNTNSDSSYRPYDPASAIGDLSPTTPKPPKHNNCGVFGQILATVVAVAASYLVGPILGNLVSQGFNNLIGLQSGFSFKSLAMSALTPMVASGVGAALGSGEMFGSQFLGDVVRGAATSAVTQGIGVATGLQDGFDWAGVAAAGVGAGIGGAVIRGLNQNAGSFDKSGSWHWSDPNFQPSFGTQAVAQAASGIAEAATRSAIDGTGFGDNLIAAIPDVVGQAFGGAIAKGLGGSVWGDKDYDGILGVLQDISEAPTKVGAAIGNAVADAVASIGRNEGLGGAAPDGAPVASSNAQSTGSDSKQWAAAHKMDIGKITDGIIDSAEASNEGNTATLAAGALSQYRGVVPNVIYDTMQRIVAGRLQSDGYLGDDYVNSGLSDNELSSVSTLNASINAAPPVLTSGELNNLSSSEKYYFAEGIVLTHANDDQNVIGRLDAMEQGEAGPAIAVGLRVATPETNARGAGVYDDVLIVMQRNGSGAASGTSFYYNADPSGQYDVRATENGKGLAYGVSMTAAEKTAWEAVTFRKPEGYDINGDKIRDAGALTEDTYYFVPKPGGYINSSQYYGGNKAPAWMSVDIEGADRITGFDGLPSYSAADFDSAHAGTSMYFHLGGNQNTFSAGCQTVPGYNYRNFVSAIGGSNSSFYYVLVNTR